MPPTMHTCAPAVLRYVLEQAFASQTSFCQKPRHSMLIRLDYAYGHGRPDSDALPARRPSRRSKDNLEVADWCASIRLRQSRASCKGVQLQPLERLLHGSYLGCTVVRDLPPALLLLSTFASHAQGFPPRHNVRSSASKVAPCASPSGLITEETTTCRLSLLSAAV